MKKVFPLLFFLLSPSLVFSETVSVSKFGGLNTDTSTLLLDGQSPDSQNVVTDEPGLSGRKGFVSFSTEPVTQMWELPSTGGTRYLIGNSGGVLKATTGGATFDIYIGTVATTQTTVGTVLGDYFYFANKTDGLKRVSFSGTTATVSVSSEAFKVDKLVTHKGRLWAAGLAGSERIVFGSKYLDGTDWSLVTDAAENDPVQITVSGALDEAVTALFSSPFDTLMWFKARSFGSISGNRGGVGGGNFTQRTHSTTIGTSYPESIQETDGVVKFLGPNRTIWEFDGGVFRPKNKISDDIDTLMGTLVQGTGSAQSNTKTTKADFDAGTYYQTSGVPLSGSVSLSTWTATDTTADDFDGGTLVNLSSTTSPGDLELARNTSSVSNQNMDGSPWSAYSTCLDGDIPAINGSYTPCRPASSNSLTVTITLGDGTPLSVASLSAPTDSWGLLSVDISAFGGKSLYFSLSCSGGVLASGLRIYGSGYGGSVFTFYAIRSSVLGYIGVDSASYDRSTIHNGTFLSQSFDTSISSPLWGANTPTATANGNTISYETQVSSDNATWDSLVAWTPGSAPASASKQYIRYKVTMSTTSSSTDFPYVSDVTLSARSSSGRHVNESYPTDSPSSWGLFETTDASDGGTITYGLYADTDSVKTVTNGVPVAGTYTSSQTITTGSVPTISTAAYFFTDAAFSITAATQAPHLDDITVRWNTGSTQKVASAYFDQRYYLGTAVNSTTNNIVLVFDKRRQWQKYVGINADAMIVYNGDLYFSNSGGLFQAEYGYDDNGTDIESYYRTESFAPSGPDMYGLYFSLYATTENSASTLGTQYELNDDGTDLSLGSYDMDTKAGVQNFKLPFPITQTHQSKYLNFKWSVTGSALWKILNANLYFTPDVQPE